MKRLLLLLILPALAGTAAYGQCCPYMGGITIEPAQPTATDPVIVITEVTTPNIGSLIYSTATVDGDTIRIDACYWEGTLTVPTPITDTLELGLLPEGEYTVLFTAYSSSSHEECIVTGQQELTETLEVGDVSGLPENENAFVLYPNPVSDLLHIAADIPVAWRLLAADGKLLEEGTETTIDFSDRSAGVYFVEIDDVTLKVQKL